MATVSFTIVDTHDKSSISFEADGEELAIEVYVPAPSGDETRVFTLDFDQIEKLKSILDLIH